MKVSLRTWTVCIGSCAALAASGARANTTYSLDFGDSDISGYTGPYGSVDVSLSDATHAVITFQAGVVDGKQFLFGADGSADFNVNSTKFGALAMSLSQLSGFTSAIISNGGGGNVSAFGTFNQRFNGFDGFTHATTTLTFSVTDLIGSWASSDDVLTPNSAGHSVAAHIFVTTYPGNVNNGALNTGFASDSVPNVADGGTTAAMLGAAISVLGVVRRKVS